jgi:hypothetical protein
MFLVCVFCHSAFDKDPARVESSGHQTTLTLLTQAFVVDKQFVYFNKVQEIGLLGQENLQDSERMNSELY